MEVCCIVFYVDMREKKQTVKYKQTLQHRNTGHNTVTQPTKGTNPIRREKKKKKKVSDPRAQVRQGEVS